MEFAILAALCKDPLSTPTEIARNLGVDRSLVRRRLASLHQRGVLRGTSAVIHPAVVGRTRRTVGGPIEKVGVAQEALRISDVMWAAETADDWLYIVQAPNGTPEPIELEGFRIEREYRQQLEPPGVLGRIELKVLFELLAEPTASNAQISRRCGLGVRSVGRARERLRGAWQAAPILGPGTGPGPLYFHASLVGPLDACRQAVAKAKCEMLSTFDTPEGAYTFCHAESLLDQKRMLKDMEATGVQAFPTLNSELAVATTRMQEWVAVEIRKWSAGGTTLP